MEEDPIQEGYAVSIEATSLPLNWDGSTTPAVLDEIDEWVDEHLPVLSEPNAFLRGGYDGNYGQLNVAMLFEEKKHAMQVGARNDQISVWGFAEKAEFATGGLNGGLPHTPKAHLMFPGRLLSVKKEDGYEPFPAKGQPVTCQHPAFSYDIALYGTREPAYLYLMLSNYFSWRSDSFDEFSAAMTEAKPIPDIWLEQLLKNRSRRLTTRGLPADLPIGWEREDGAPIYPPYRLDEKALRKATKRG